MDLAVIQGSPRTRWSLGNGLAGFGLSPIMHLAAEQERVRKRRQGRIVVEQGRLLCIHGRWWPHCGSLMEVLWDTKRRGLEQDRCELYYQHPWASPNYLTLSYVRSGALTSLSSFYAATVVLDAIAQIKQTDAIVCHVTNDRISDRLLQRWGWQQHCLDWSGRHYIKRFYGRYPEISRFWRQRLTLAPPT